MLLVSVLLEDGLEALLKTLHRGLTSSKQGEARQLKKSECIFFQKKRSDIFAAFIKSYTYRKHLTRSMVMSEIFPVNAK